MILEYAITTGFLMSDEAEIDTTPNRREQQEIKYQERLDACARKTVNIGEKAETGDCHHVFFRCGLIDCPFCGPWEVQKRVEAISESMESSGPMRIIRGITKDEQKKLVRKYKAINLESNPIQDGDKVVFDVVIKTTDEIGEVYAGPTEEEVRRWLSPVYGHNKSGKLFEKVKVSELKEKESQLEPKSQIQTELQQVDFSLCNQTTGEKHTHDWWAQLVIDLAIWQTSHLKPIDEFTLREALEERRKVRANIIEKLGGVVIRVEERRKYIKLNNIDWQKPLDRVEERKEELEKWVNGHLTS